MTPTDPGVLLLIPLALLVMVGIAWPLENTERGRRLTDRLLRMIERR